MVCATYPTVNVTHKTYYNQKDFGFLIIERKTEPCICIYWTTYIVFPHL